MKNQATLRIRQAESGSDKVMGAPSSGTSSGTSSGALSSPPAAGREPAGKAMASPAMNYVRGVDFSGGDWRGQRISETVFENVSFQGADLRGAVFENVVFRRCNFQGACLDGARLRQVSAMYLLAEGASLRQVQGENTHWIGCFREADFTGSHWRDSSFYSSDLRDAIGVQSFRGGQVRAAVSPGQQEDGQQKEMSGVVSPLPPSPMPPSPAGNSPANGSPAGGLPANGRPPFRLAVPRR